MLRDYGNAREKGCIPGHTANIIHHECSGAHIGKLETARKKNVSIPSVRQKIVKLWHNLIDNPFCTFCR